MLQPNFTPFPTIQTERLLLRQLNPADAEAMYALRTDEKVFEFTDIPRPKDLADAAAYIERILGFGNNNEAIMWAITLLHDPRLIGTVCFWNLDKESYRAEIGYILHSTYHNKGYMTEAVAAILPYGLNQIKLHTVEGRTDPQNVGSIKVMERNGFIREAWFKENYYMRGSFRDTVVYTLFNKA
jgi:ribosomal-protein-alanine N-acetyltransferase